MSPESLLVFYPGLLLFIVAAFWILEALHQQKRHHLQRRREKCPCCSCKQAASPGQWRVRCRRCGILFETSVAGENPLGKEDQVQPE